MKSIKILSVFITLSFPVISVAECQSTSCDNVNIENLYITSSSNILVTTSGTESSLNCSGTDGKYLTLDTNSKNSKEIYAALLSARTINQPMQIVINKESSGCIIKRVEFGKYFN